MIWMWLYVIAGLFMGEVFISFINSDEWKYHKHRTDDGLGISYLICVFGWPIIVLWVTYRKRRR